LKINSVSLQMRAATTLRIFSRHPDNT
jgi:hypothetical protein